MTRNNFPPTMLQAEENGPEPSAHYFYIILSCVILLSAMGMALVYSASSVRLLSNWHEFYVGMGKNLLYYLVGFLALTIVSKLPVWLLEASTYIVFPFAFALQILTFFIGKEIGGNRNWLTIPMLGDVQPSELLKLAFIMALSLLLTRFPLDLRQGVNAYVYLTGLLILGVGPVILCGDMGSSIIFVVIFFIMILMYGAKIQYLGFLVIVGVAAGAYGVMHNPTRLARVSKKVMSIFGMAVTEEKTGPEQSDHALWAIGNGGLAGVGPGGSREKWLRLPTADSDYVFAVLAEEYGFLGGLAVLAIFFLLMYAIFQVAWLQQVPWLRFVCLGMGVWISFQAAVNIGVVIGVLPVLGVPLPFISRGFSALLSTLAGMGIVLAAAKSVPGAKLVFSTRARSAKRVNSVLSRTAKS
ncbi:FtsW/RodA/SpoVE family cell cycle protein [Boudabousia tangfeifanii]|nr:FtsW/RodA/SpoVE family cell cycle protein [Boudabousia tangfeifanii]